MKTLKYAWRFLMRSKSYTIINLLGLAFSLACSIILMRYIHRELTVDAHSVDPEHIIIPIRDIEGNLHPGSLQQGWSETDSVYIPDHQIVEQCRLMLQQRDNVVYENSNYAMNIAAVDSTFFHFFHYPVAAGEAHLDAPGDAIITQRYARNIFGKENPIGKVLEYYGKNITIKGVIGELGCKSLLRFDLLVSYRLVEHWQRMDISLMRILPGVDLDKINKASNVYRKDKRGNRIRWEFITWKNLYWRNSIGHDDDYDSIIQFGNRTHLYILSGVTILLLLVGILNFINIYMVFMMKRSKEYGVKKVFGLQRLPLFLQIWIENLLLAFAALLTAWLLIEATQVPVSRWMNEQISLAACFMGTGKVQAQEFTIQGDLVSSYVWRGFYQTGASFQPTLGFGVGDFSLTAWGSTDFDGVSSGEGAAAKEIDLTAAYALGESGLTFSVASLWWGGQGARKYFNFKSHETAHHFEAGLAYTLPVEKFPLSIAWYTMFAGADKDDKGRQNYSSYVELNYPFSVKSVDLNLTCGFLPYEAGVGVYGVPNSGFAVTNVALKGITEIKITDNFSIPVFAQAIWNPRMEDAHLVFGFTLRP